MSWIALWLKHRAVINGQRTYIRGFDWAAGRLLQGMDPAWVESQCDGSHPKDFDQGIRDALILANKKRRPG